MLIGENSILQRGVASKERTVKAKIEEAVKLAGTGSVIDQYNNKTESVTLANIVSKLGIEGYEIVTKLPDENEEVISGIELNTTNVSFEKGGTSSIIVTFIQNGDLNIQYYVKQDNKYYEVKMLNGEVKVLDPITEIDETEVATITVSSSDENIVKATVSGNTITLTGKTKIGTATVTVKYGTGGDNFEKECKVVVSGEENISTTQSYVGYYADTDGDGTVDGIIFADLAVGGSGKWSSYASGKYTIPVKDNLKSYYISQSDYVGQFEKNDVISTDDSETGKNDRFYVMALTNIKENTAYDWYNSAYNKMEDYSTDTSVDFGKGKENTETMIAKWDEEKYGKKDNCSTHKDMWGQIKTQVANGWFVPSRGEWATFAGELGITKSNYSSKGLSMYYWTSSQTGIDYAWYVHFR